MLSVAANMLGAVTREFDKNQKNWELFPPQQVKVTIINGRSGNAVKVIVETSYHIDLTRADHT